MAVESTLAFFLNADQSLQINVKSDTALTTPQTMTGWALMFVLRSTDGRLVLSKTVGSGIAIGNGSGTDDRATVTIADTDTLGWPAGRAYEYALWRTDDPTDVPLVYGPATATKVAVQL